MRRPLPLTAVLLAGGASRRMGRNKGLLRLGGVRIVDLLVSHFAARCRATLVARGKRPIPRLEAPQLGDPRGLEGPLAGLAAGLAASPTPWVLLVACDQPPLPDALLSLLWRRRKGLSAALDQEAHPLPFPALYHRKALGRIRAGGGPSWLLKVIPGRRIPERLWRGSDPGGLALMNWNTRAEFRRLAPLTLGTLPP